MDVNEWLSDTAHRLGVHKNTVRSYLRRGLPEGTTIAEVKNWHALNVKRNGPPTLREKQQRNVDATGRVWARLVAAEEELWWAVEELAGNVPDDELAAELLEVAWCSLIRRPGMACIKDFDTLRELLGEPPQESIDQPRTDA